MEIFDRVDKSIRDISNKSSAIISVAAISILEEMIRPMLPHIGEPTMNRFLNASYSGAFFVLKSSVAV